MRAGLPILLASALLGACGPAAEAPTAEAPTAEAEGAPTIAPATASNAAYPALTGRVVDAAGLLTPDQEQGLSRELERLEARTTDQLVIATIESLEGRALEEYARGLGNHWGIGREDRDNGVLLLVVPSERKVRIAVGYGLEPILTNDRASEIIQQDLLPNFQKARWNEGLHAGTRSIIATLIAAERQPRQGRP